MEVPRATLPIAGMHTEGRPGNRARWSAADAAARRRAMEAVRTSAAPDTTVPAITRRAALAAVVRIAQHAREAEGGGCPRCGSRNVIGWGGFSGRCRYRCRGCGRTFSDFTGTPIAYSKRAESWMVYADCMLNSLTVRRSAAEVNIRVPTSFRWRHAILGALRRAPAPVLAGRVEVTDARYRHSEKGAHRARSTAGPRHARSREPVERHVLVVFGCDAAHSTFAEVAGEHLLSAAMLSEVLVACTARGSAIVAPAGRFSPYAAACRRVGLQFRPASRRWRGPGDARHACHSARRLRSRFESWVGRFHGVATRYLPNYLRWSLYLGAGGEPSDGDAGARLVAACCRGVPVAATAGQAWIAGENEHQAAIEAGIGSHQQFP
jgi:transposase-like protein